MISTKFIRRHQKKILAVFTVGLMITFTIDYGYRRTGGIRSGEVIGSIGNTSIYNDQLQLARRQWEILKSTPYKDSRLSDPNLSLPSPYNMFNPDMVHEVLSNTSLPLYFILASPQVAAECAWPRGRDLMLAAQINRNPELFLMLIMEARQMGVTVSPERVNSILQDAQLPDNSAHTENSVRDAIASLLLIDAARQRATDVIKISKPMLNQSMAMAMQEISVNLVELDADRFRAKVPAPTTQQASDHFIRYAAVNPATAESRNNPFAFGYLYPNRVKVQYLAIPREEISRVIVEGKAPAAWEVEAQKYYLRHKAEFPSTHPETQPQTQPATQPDARPFAEVRQQILDILQKEPCDNLQAEIQQKITATLTSDYQAYQAAQPAATQPASTQPAAGPVTSFGVPYGSYDYLLRLADSIQARYKVKVYPVNLQQKWWSEKELADLKGIGNAKIGQMSFAYYATHDVKDFNKSNQPRMQEAPILEKMEPSLPLKDETDSVYFFRVLAADPSHPPVSIAEVAEQVNKDLIASASFDQARTAARDLMSAAIAKDLAEAAKSAHEKVIHTGLFPYDPQATITGYPLASSARAEFIQMAFSLLGSKTRNRDNFPVELLELPRQHKILVMELAQIVPEWNADTYVIKAASYARAMAERREAEFTAGWYDYESVKNRLHYKPLKEKE